MTPYLDVKDLEAWYGESHVLHGVNLTVNPGETICIPGRDGRGKTSTLRAIMGHPEKRSGSVRLGDTDLMAVPLHRVAQAGLGFVPEERGIFWAVSVRENLTLPSMVAPGGMSRDEIYDLAPNLPERRRSQGTRLSGGASSRCSRLPASCAPARNVSCWTRRPRVLPP